MRSARHLRIASVLLIVLGGITATVVAHPVITPNETISAAGTLIGLLRVLSLALTVGWAGWSAYSLLDRESGINRRGYAVGMLLVLISLWSDLALYAASVSESGIEHLYFSARLPGIALASEYAALWIVRVIGVLLLGAPLIKISLINAAYLTHWLALLGGMLVSVMAAAVPALLDARAAAIITQQAETPPSALIIPIAGQALHLYLAALWAGGLISVLWVRLRQKSAAQTAIRAFLRYTQWLLAVMAVTGLLLAWLHAGSLTALLQTGYGWLTLLKAGIIFSLLIIGQRMSQRMPSTGTAAMRGLVFQAGLIGAALVASALLGTLDSARRVADWRADEYFHSFDNSFYEPQIVRPLEIDLFVIPGLTGQNRLIVTLIDSETGTRLDDAQQVAVTLNDQPPLMLEPAGDGNYLTLTELTASRDWQAQVEVAHADIIRSADFTFSVNLPPPDLPNLLTIEQPERFTALDRAVSAVCGLLLAGLGASEVMRVWRRRQKPPGGPAGNITGSIGISGALCSVIGLCLLLAAVL